MDACTNCGHCCTPCIPMTQEEIDVIKQYIVDHNIEEMIYTKDGRLEYICPFRDKENKQCNIYEVRPEVCQRYECWTEGLGFEGHVERLVDTAVDECDAHKVFFNNLTFKTDYQNENE